MPVTLHRDRDAIDLFACCLCVCLSVCLPASGWRCWRWHWRGWRCRCRARVSTPGWAVPLRAPCSGASMRWRHAGSPSCSASGPSTWASSRRARSTFGAAAGCSRLCRWCSRAWRARWPAGHSRPGSPWAALCMGLVGAPRQTLRAAAAAAAAALLLRARLLHACPPAALPRHR